MLKTTTRLKGWGNSIGVVLPKNQLEKENLRIDEEVEIALKRRSFPLRKVYGKLKGIKPKTKKSIGALIKEIDSEMPTSTK